MKSSSLKIARNSAAHCSRIFRTAGRPGDAMFADIGVEHVESANETLCLAHKTIDEITADGVISPAEKPSFDAAMGAIKGLTY